MLRIYWQAKTTRNALLLGLVSGLALLTKFSMIVLIPVLACLALAGIVFAPRLGFTRRRLILHGGMVLVLVLLMINAAYRFQGPPIVRGDVQWVQARSPEAFDRWMTFFRVALKGRAYLLPLRPVQRNASQSRRTRRIVAGTLRHGWVGGITSRLLLP